MPARVGIMADSHGEAGRIQQAIDLFTRQGCTRWIHLGDMVDSALPGTARPCLDLLLPPQAIALCGNNENTLRLNLRGRPDDGLGARLAALPVTLTIASVILAHSLPFVDQLGTSCTRIDMDGRRAQTFFNLYPGCHLMRGHGHQPESIRREDARLVMESPAPGQTYKLEARCPRILTCGALALGWVMIWDRRAEEIQYLRMA